MTALVEVTYLSATGKENVAYFGKSFTIGRDSQCELVINHRSVSDRHLCCELHHKTWWLRDLNRPASTFANGEVLAKMALDNPIQIMLGRQGPVLQFALRQPAASKTSDVTTERFVSSVEAVPAKQPAASGMSVAGVRRAMQLSAQKQTLRYRSAMALVLLALLGVSGFAYQQYSNTQKLNTLGQDMFYAIKTMELQIMNLQSALFASDSNLQDFYGEHLDEQKKRLLTLRQQYSDFMANAHQAGLFWNDEDRLIMQVVRQFGESEHEVPVDFIAEIKRYIRKWRSTGRLQRGMRRLQENNYLPIITKALQQYQLPHHFLYLALQESDFKADAVGPNTRYGYAKGMWQFIPDTASRYGLKLGPNVSQPVFDQADERHDAAKSSQAAARYLHDIYRTDAQASGLLVMASYNWGEGNILHLLEQMPENPRERNFWSLLRQHKIPKQTYDYVFYIVSAAVIGSNPKLFGFDFDNPLASLD